MVILVAQAEPRLEQSLTTNYISSMLILPVLLLYKSHFSQLHISIAYSTQVYSCLELDL